MSRIIALLALTAAMVVGAGSVRAQTGPGCTFVLGFATLHDLLPSIVGDCLQDEQHNPENGDGLQHTTDGLLVWRHADNFTAFTDGYRTWVNGPNGVQERLNSQRFAWETNPDGLPVVASGTSGIDGVITLGPTSPVCRVGVPCGRPLAATVVVHDAAGRFVLQFTSGADGTFRVDLPPGSYTLIPAPIQPGSPFPRAVPTSVTVVSGVYTQTVVTYDTGIR